MAFHDPGQADGASGGAPDAGRRERGVYTISVAVELTGIDARTLRAYDRAGLLEPGRSSGGNRRYSDADLDQVRRIHALAVAGLNTTGIAHVLHLEEENQRLRTQLDGTRDGDVEHDGGTNHSESRPREEPA